MRLRSNELQRVIDQRVVLSYFLGGSLKISMSRGLLCRGEVLFSQIESEFYTGFGVFCRVYLRLIVA